MAVVPLAWVLLLLLPLLRASACPERWSDVVDQRAMLSIDASCFARATAEDLRALSDFACGWINATQSAALASSSERLDACGGLSAGCGGNMSLSGLSGVSCSCVAGLSAAFVGTLSALQLGSVTPGALSGLGASNAFALKSSCSGLSAAQVAQIKARAACGALQPECARSLRPGVMRYLDPECLGQADPSFFGALSAQQVAGLPLAFFELASGNQMAQLGTSCSGLNAMDVSMLYHVGVCQKMTPLCWSSVPPESFAGLTQMCGYQLETAHLDLVSLASLARIPSNALSSLGTGIWIHFLRKFNTSFVELYNHSHFDDASFFTAMNVVDMVENLTLVPFYHVVSGRPPGTRITWMMLALATGDEALGLNVSDALEFDSQTCAGLRPSLVPLFRGTVLARFLRHMWRRSTPFVTAKQVSEIPPALIQVFLEVATVASFNSSAFAGITVEQAVGAARSVWWDCSVLRGLRPEVLQELTCAKGSVVRGLSAKLCGVQDCKKFRWSTEHTVIVVSCSAALAAILLTVAVVASLRFWHRRQAKGRYAPVTSRATQQDE